MTRNFAILLLFCGIVGTLLPYYLYKLPPLDPPCNCTSKITNIVHEAFIVYTYCCGDICADPYKGARINQTIANFTQCWVGLVDSSYFISYNQTFFKQSDTLWIFTLVEAIVSIVYLSLFICLDRDLRHWIVFLGVSLFVASLETNIYKETTYILELVFYCVSFLTFQCVLIAVTMICFLHCREKNYNNEIV